MNIKEAKQEIKNTLDVYFTKDEFGNYLIPIEKQRPVFLMGPPGIGKTAIMAQIASEMGVGLLSYSMTHHTRQSAIGLPFIEKKVYGGVEYTVSEYTLSEIVASVYQLMENTGLKEGILFLDEINCVSETLAPVMLQLLQYKVFGMHKIPRGWVIVTAGNPPEYNNAVREYDIATWDRLKRIDITPDFEIWKEYAYKSNIHMAIISYLESKTADFYSIETTVDSKSFATARGWEDLSQMITRYEKRGIPVQETLISQYLQHRKVSKSFSAYYDLYVKYRGDYQIDKITDGQWSPATMQKAREAKFDERVMLISLILDALNEDCKDIVDRATLLAEIKKVVRTFVNHCENDDKPIDALNSMIEKQKKNLEKRLSAGNLSESERMVFNGIYRIPREAAQRCHDRRRRNSHQGSQGQLQLNDQKAQGRRKADKRKDGQCVQVRGERIRRGSGDAHTRDGAHPELLFIKVHLSLRLRRVFQAQQEPAVLRERQGDPR